MSTIAGQSPDAAAERNMATWGARVERDTAFWEVRSRTNNTSLEMQISDFFTRVHESLDGLVALRNKVDDCQLQIIVSSDIAGGGTLGFHIELEQMAILAALRAEVDFEIYTED
jgi:hypothetical protein